MQVMYRFRKNYNKYIHREPDTTCALCDSTRFSVIEQGMHCRVVRNNYPYDVWENTSVLEHLMIVPNQHVANLGDTTTECMHEIMKYMAKYEYDGYNIYARTTDNNIRSIGAHQHTHLIKIDDSIAGASLYIKKPYLLLKL